MVKAVLVALLLAVALSQSTFTYAFSAQSTSSQTKPSYSLGALAVGDVLNITISIPNPTGTTLSSFVVQLMTSSNLPLSPAVFLSLTGTTGSASWTVVAAGSYSLQVTTATSPITSVVMYCCSVVKNGAQLLSVTDVLRQNVFKYFYLSQFNNSLTVTATGGSVLLYSMSSSNQFSISNGGPLTLVGNSATVTSLPAGYYGLEVVVSAMSLVVITYQSYNYNCPFISGCSDVNGIFAGCLSSTSSFTIGLPCTSNDPSTGKCLSCLTGYSLNNGQCVSNTPCGARQYTHFGNCFNVSDACNTFAPFTGACITCVQATYVLRNGQCVPSSVTPVVCSNGTHLYLSTCIPDSCSAIHSNGSCSACVNSAFQLKTNGSCVSINCGNGSYFSTSLALCQAIPAQCSDFSIILQACQACNSGFFLNASAACVQPSGSVNCLSWMFSANYCSQCKKGYSWTLNVCTLNAPVASSCPTGKILVGTICVILPSHCQSLSRYYHCTQCDLGYRLTAGECLLCNGPNPAFPCTICPLNHSIDSKGRCMKTYQHCATASSTTG